MTMKVRLNNYLVIWCWRNFGHCWKIPGSSSWDRTLNTIKIFWPITILTLQSYVLDSTANRHDLDSLALNYLQRTTTHYEDVAGKGSKQIPFNQVAIEDAAPYAAEDADITLQLHQNFWPELQLNKKLQDIYQGLEIPLLSVLSQVERNGVVVDADMLGQQSHELESRMGELEQQAHDLAKQTFNIGSPKQIQKILYEDMQLPILAKTPKGQPSTAESVLQELAQDYDLPRLILDYRSLSKLKSTYTDKLPGQIDADTGRVHTSYHQKRAGVSARLLSRQKTVYYWRPIIPR